MAKVIIVPDGNGGYNEMYTAPMTTKEANEWLSRVGAKHLKFSTNKGEAVLKDVNTNRVYLSANKISDICYFLSFQPLQMRKYGIAGYDWFRPDEAWNTTGPVNVTVTMQ